MLFPRSVESMPLCMSHDRGALSTCSMAKLGPRTSGRPLGSVLAQVWGGASPPCVTASKSGCDDRDPWRNMLVGETPPGETGGTASSGLGEENCSRHADRSCWRLCSDEPVGAVAGLVTLWLGSRGSPGEREM